MAAGTPVALGQAGPDVIVGDLPGTQYYGSVGGIHAYSVATTSCNVGNAQLLWIQNSNRHPVIAQNMYRIADGRIEQIGQSWLKHGFCALQQSLCEPCQPAGGGCVDRLGIGCSDPYSAGLNGEQGNLGPRSEVNATSGEFIWPFGTRNQTGNAIYKRLQVAQADLQTPGGRYLIEGQYVTFDDSSAGNSANNASYRRAVVNPNFSLNLQGQTVREQGAIYAWRDHGLGTNIPDPDVHIIEVDNPGDGRFVIGYKVSDNGDGTWHYEYAIFNLNSHKSAGGVTVPLGINSTATNVGFHDVPSHSGEPYDNTDWTIDATSGQVTWSSPQTFAENPNSNALRWGTMYNFRFDSTGAPVEGDVTVSLFKANDSFAVSAMVPGSTGPLPVILTPADPIPEFANPGDEVTVSVTIDAGDDQIVAGSAMLFYRASSGDSFGAVPMAVRSGEVWEAELPARECADSPEFYFAVEGVATGVVTLPADAPTSIFSVIVGDGDVQDDDLETDTGWTVGAPGDAATTGVWVRVDPNGTVAQPENDNTADPGVNCWVTGNTIPGASPGSADVDGGRTTLTSPAYDLSAADSAEISYYRWFSNDTGPNPAQDVFRVQISSDGATWVTVETVGPDTGEHSGGWFEHSFNPADFVPLTSGVQLRFIAEDINGESTVEAAIDDVRVVWFGCEDEAPCPGDYNGDGARDTSDFFEFFADFFASPPDADYNNDGSTDTADFFEFFADFFGPPCA